MIKSRFIKGLSAGIAAVALLAGCSTGGSQGGSGGDDVVINQAFQSLLYLPLYVAEDQGFFAEEGVNAKIVTGGGGTQSWSAVLGGSADYSIQDPVFVPKSRESGGQGVVVAGIHEAPSLYILGKDATSLQDDLSPLEGKKVVVSPEPDTSWAFMSYLIDQEKLQGVQLVNVSLGNELAAVVSGQADYALATEPQVSQAEAQGMHIVYSFPANKDWSPFAFSSLTTTQGIIDANPEKAQSVVTAFEKSYKFIYANPGGAVAVAEKYFPDIDPAVVRAAVERNIAVKGYPTTALVTEESWSHNLEIAEFVGNVKEYPSDATSYDVNVNTELANNAAKAVGVQ